jgi:hypothetical protein
MGLVEDRHVTANQQHPKPSSTADSIKVEPLLEERTLPSCRLLPRETDLTAGFLYLPQ